MKNAERAKKNILFVVCALAVAIFNQVKFPGYFWNYEKGALVSLAYLAIIVRWGASALDRIREKKSRRVMIGIIFLLCFWMIVRGIKYDIALGRLEKVYLWYLFYIPQTFLPLMVFYMTLHIEYSKKYGKALWLLLPTALMSLGVLTNNYHFLAFDFGNQLIQDEAVYSYGVLFYVCWGWTVFFLLAAVVNAARKSKLLHLRRAMIAIILWLLFAAGYMIYYVYGPFWTRSRIFNFPEASCLYYIVFLEICIQRGLLLSSSNHADIFRAASLMAEITDEEDETYAKTSLCPEITEEQKQASKQSSLIINQTYECRSNPLEGGRVYWLNDISDLLEINHELEDMGDQISEENNILEAEIQAKEQKAALEEQNRIYNEVNAAIDLKSDKMFELLEEPDNLKKALILAAYMKRKGNLVILSRQESEADIRELGLCINESFSYLRLAGVICNCTISGEGTMDTKRMADLYDLFEEILETGYEQLEAFLCYVKKTEQGLNVRCQLEFGDEPEESNARIEELAAEKHIGLETEVQDNTLYLTLYAKEVGA